IAIGEFTTGDASQLILSDDNTTGRGKESFVCSHCLDGNAIYRTAYTGYGALFNLPLQYFHEAHFPGDMYFTAMYYAQEHD
ncbi:hypothetical protein J3459_012116, partial [Metarhizium acridum]